MNKMKMIPVMICLSSLSLQQCRCGGSGTPDEANQKMTEIATELELRKLPVRFTDTESILTFHVSIPERCELGDMDIITKELSSSKTDSVIISVEPLRKNADLQPVVREVPLGDIKNGFSAEFVLPRVSKPTHLGLFLCKDTKGEGACRDKQVKDLNAIWEQHTYQKSAGGTSFVAPDRIYFFQHLYLSHDDLESFGRELLEKEEWDKFALYSDLKESSQNDEGTPLDSFRSRLEELMFTIRSLNLFDNDSNAIGVEFPVRNAGLCDH